MDCLPISLSCVFLDLGVWGTRVGTLEKVIKIHMGTIELACLQDLLVTVVASVCQAVSPVCS